MRPVIYFVHGALSTRRSFNYIKAQLSTQVGDDTEAELKKLAKYEHRSFDYDIREERGEDLISRLTGQLIDVSKRPITLICHSFGGVIGVAAARNVVLSVPAARINIVTMSSPFGGSAAASMLKLIKPDSTFFENIGTYGLFMKSLMRQPLPFRTKALITTEGDADWLDEPNDGVVTVDSQLYYMHDPLFHPFEIKLNHFEVLLSDQTVSYIKRELLH